jgi:hypothetical protein
MKRIGIVAIALAVACGWAGVANASSHGLMPANLFFWEMVNWQLVHFRLHIDFVYAALTMTVTSPQTAWMLLSNQTLCAGTSPWTAFLFGSPGMSLVTFFVTVFTPIGLFFLALRRAIKIFRRHAHTLLPLFGFVPRLVPA